MRAVMVMLKGGAEWQKLVWNRAARIRADLDEALPPPPPAEPEEAEDPQSEDPQSEDPRRQRIQHLLDRAEGAAEARPRFLSALRQWWYGSMSDFAWLSLHEAEAQVARLESDGQAEIRARCLLEKASTLLPLRDTAVSAVREELIRREIKASTSEKRAEGSDPDSLPALVANLSRAVQDASDEHYAQSRSFRNRLIRLSLTALIFLALTMFPVATNVVDLWRHSGEPSSLHVAIGVALFGAIGAFVASVPSLARTSGSWNPFSLPLYQMYLKLLLGPIFAYVGILLLGSGLVPNISSPRTFIDVLVWSVVFGAGQQAVTRIVDSRVAGLVSGDTSSSSGSAAAHTEAGS